MEERPANWSNLNEEELLKVRLCDLGVHISGSFVEQRVGELYHELEVREFKYFHPVCYLGDEWFSPEGFTAISIPFYLAHPRLTALERKHMLEAEGDTPEWCMKLLRHEAGHCFDHAYQFSKTKAWQKVFGSPDKTYAPESFHARPYSRNFVRHLDNFYAQAHPDEDFAETFAVWLTPNSNWENEYAKWNGALEKLRYVDSIAKSVRMLPPRAGPGTLPFKVSNLRRTLKAYYEKKHRENADDFPDYFDRDLHAIFPAELNTEGRDRAASSFIKRHCKHLIEVTTRWTGARKYTIHSLIKRIMKRCDTLSLRVTRDDGQTLLDIAAFVAAMVSRYLYTGRYHGHV